MKSILTGTLLCLSQITFGQAGTMTDPFTSLSQTLGLGSAGIYYFDLGGTTFNTHVDANGYVLIAIDFGNGSGALPQGNSLSLAARGVMNTTVLSSITSHTEIRISSSTGNFDVTTNNPTLLARITSNSSLMSKSSDNILNSSWTGIGSSSITGGAASGNSTSVPNNLQNKIFHSRGNTSQHHWISASDVQREAFDLGEIGSSESLRLWVRDGTFLPIELLDFNATPANNEIILTWETASEANNDFFTVERSVNGTNWEEIQTIDGAGNSSLLLEYSIIDQHPLRGISYYRLKQTDFDGQFTYSPIKVAELNDHSDDKILLYPNPASNELTVSGDQFELEEIAVFNSIGENVTSSVTIDKVSNEQCTIGLTELSAGIYFIKTATTTSKVIRRE